MATATKSKTAAAKAKAGKGKVATGARAKTAAATEAKTTATPGKRAASKERDAEFTTTILERRGNGEAWGVIASDLGITPGKAQFLVMLHRVAEGEVPKITGRNDAELEARLKKARQSADQYSSWGWLAARSGKSEVFLKALANASGWYEPKAENIAAVRAANKPKAEKATATGKTTTTKATGAKVSAKAAAAKAKAKANKSSESDPS